MFGSLLFDSIATLGLPGDGIGLNYHLGLFKQEFEKNLQKEVPTTDDNKKLASYRNRCVYPAILGDKDSLLCKR